MKNILYTFILALLGCGLLTSCEDYVDIDIPGQEKKIVVFSYISPQDTMVRAFVSASVPMYDTVPFWGQTTSVFNATVELSDGISSVILPFDSENNEYAIPASQYTIVAGRTYYLKVDVPGYPTVSAETVVPAQTPQISSFNLVSLPATSEFEMNNRYRLDVAWQDFTAEENYYNINVFDENISPENITGYFSYEVSSHQVSDEGSDGQTLNIRADIYGSFTYPDSEMETNFKVYILNVTKDYYLFHRSIEYISTGDPFSEPTITYSNVQNGLGCFAAFNGSYITIPY